MMYGDSGYEASELRVDEVDPEIIWLDIPSGTLIPLANGKCRTKFRDHLQDGEVEWATFESKQLAMDHLRRRSKECGTTTTTRASYYDRDLDVPEAVKKQIAGFFDGDGIISIAQNAVLVSFGQSCQSGEPLELKLPQQYYGSMVKDRKHKLGPKVRRHWHLDLRNWTVLSFIQDMLPYCIVKHRQLVLVLEFLTNSDRKDKARVRWFVSECKRLKKDYANTVVDIRSITPEWLGGFFVAEGGVTMSPASYYIHIHQLGARIVIWAIAHLTGGCVHESFRDCNVRIYTAGTIMSFIDSVLPYIWGRKQDEISLLKEFLQQYPPLKGGRGVKRTVEEVAARLEVNGKLSQLAHI
jgi:hypothetical protein